jgi:hypothetical protein
VKLTSRWGEMPKPLRDHLVTRLTERRITINDLKALQFWIETEPEVPDEDWFKDFGTFVVCGTGPYMKTFLDGDMEPYGVEIF